MTKIYPFIAVIAMVCAFSLASCGGSDNSETEFKPNAVPFDSNSDREYLEQTANLFLGYFNANDQRSATIAMQEFVRLCSEYTLPDNYVDDRYAGLQKSAAAFSHATETNDWLAISRATTEFVYNFARFTGLYQANPTTRTWDRIEDRDHIDFRFWIGATQYDITLQGAGGSWSDIYTNADGTFKVEVPKNLTLNMTYGSTSYTNLMNATINSDVKDNDHANITVFCKFANIVVDTSIKAISSKILESTLLSIDNTSTLVRTKLAASETTVLGHDLCSAALWDKVIQDNDDAHMSALIGDVVSSFSNTLMVLQRVQLKSSSNDITALIDYSGGYWDKYNSPNPAQSAKDAAAHLSKSFTSQMFYAGDPKLVRGTIGWEAYQSYDDPDYTEWAVRPTITLASDGSVTDFESFFGNGRFFSVERNFQTLMNGYKSYWK